MSRTNITTELQSKIIELREQGLSIDKIAEALNIGTSTVYRKVSEYGIPDIKIKITEEIGQEIINLLDEGLFPPDIAKRLNLTATTITKYLKDNNITKVGRSYSTGLTFEQEEKIKGLISLGFGREKIADLIGVSESFVRTFCRNMGIKNENNKSALKITLEMGKQIIELHNNGLNTVKIGEKFNIHKSAVSRFLIKNNIPVKKELTEEEKKLKKELKRLRKNFSKAIHRELRNLLSNEKYESFTNHLPYTIKDLKEHLEKQFEPWMTWDNWGPYIKNKWNNDDPATWTWHIDHIIPVSEFIYNNMKDQSFKDCWALNNLRPLSARQNVEDGAKKIRHNKDEIAA